MGGLIEGREVAEQWEVVGEEWGDIASGIEDCGNRRRYCWYFLRLCVGFECLGLGIGGRCEGSEGFEMSVQNVEAD